MVTIDDIRALESKLVFFRVRQAFKPELFVAGRYRRYRRLDLRDMTGWVTGWNEYGGFVIIRPSITDIGHSRFYRILLDDIYGFRVLMDSADEELPGPCLDTDELITYLLSRYDPRAEPLPEERVRAIERHLEWCIVCERARLPLADKWAREYAVTGRP